MIAVTQRVARASVRVNGEIVGQVDRGVLVLVCAQRGDDPENARKLAQKIVKCRMFTDAAGKMNLSVRDIEGSILAVSQFTLAADTASGNRPSFSGAAPSEEGRALYEEFVAELKRQGLPVQTGVFGAHMEVDLINDGPVTLLFTDLARKAVGFNRWI
jgi:D-tyrosyl-tRNA(Tyr) deacylase